MKRILVLSDWFDPAYKAGGPIRSCINFINYMHKDYQIFLLAGDRDLCSANRLEGITTDIWNDYHGMAKVMYADPSSLNTQKMQQIIEGIAPDFVYLNSFFSKKFSQLPLRLKRSGKIKAKVVLAPRGMLLASSLSHKPLKKSVFVRLFRLLGVHRLVRFQATDTQEVNDILKHFPKAETVLVPNMPGAISDPLLFIPKVPGELRLIYVARIHPLKNVDYLLTLLKEMSYPVQCTIIGALEDAAYWNKCKDLIAAMPGHVKVNYLGEQPHKRLLDEISGHHIFAFPTKGENFGHAILEAFSMGRPVLTSIFTPWQNLAARKAGWDIPLDKPNQFMDALNTAAAWNQEQFEEWGRGAQEVAKEFIKTSDIRTNYLKLFS